MLGKFLSNFMATTKKKRVSKFSKKKNTLRKFKPMNCNPTVQGKTVVKDSCFTVDTIQKIKDAYNNTHPDNKITINEPYLLWHELKMRIRNCESEDCWLEKIGDKKLEKEIDRLSFAPYHPKEWKKNPDEWLSNYDILEVLEQYQEKYKNFKFIGPSPIDFDSKDKEKKDKCVWEELCNFSLRRLDKRIDKIGIVFNLDKHDEPGSHWVSLFIDLKHNFIFYFDSAGDKIPAEVDALVKRISKESSAMNPSIKFRFIENHPFSHQNGNTECGMYALFFIIGLLTQKIDGKEYENIDDVIKIFTSKRIRDKHVFNYRKIYFNSN